jgi:hypothetical protein
LTALEDRGLAIMPKLCEDCEGKHASFGTQAEGKKRWCGSCGKPHGAVNIHTHRRRQKEAEAAAFSDRRIATAAAAAAAAVPALAPLPVPQAAVKIEAVKRVKREEGAAAARQEEARLFGAQGAEDPPPAKQVKLEVKLEVKQELETAAARTALADTARLVEKRTFQLLAGSK